MGSFWFVTRTLDGTVRGRAVVKLGLETWSCARVFPGIVRANLPVLGPCQNRVELLY